MNAKNKYLSELRLIKEEMLNIQNAISKKFKRFKDINGLIMICLLLYSCLITICISENITLLGEDVLICTKKYTKYVHILLEFGIDNFFRKDLELNFSSMLNVLYGFGSVLLIVALSVIAILIIKFFVTTINIPEWAIANVVSLSLLCSSGAKIKSYFFVNLFVIHCILVIPIAFLIAKIYIFPQSDISFLIRDFIENKVSKNL